MNVYYGIEGVVKEHEAVGVSLDSSLLECLSPSQLRTRW